MDHADTSGPEQDVPAGQLSFILLAWPHYLTPPQGPKDPTPCGTLPGRKRRRMGTRVRRKPSTTCLATGSTGTGDEKSFWLPIATTAPELFVLLQVPATALSVLCLPKSSQGTPLSFHKAAKQTCLGLWLERNVSKELLLFLEHTMDAVSHQGDLHRHLTHLKIDKDWFSWTG